MNRAGQNEKTPSVSQVLQDNHGVPLARQFVSHVPPIPRTYFGTVSVVFQRPRPSFRTGIQQRVDQSEGCRLRGQATRGEPQ